MSSAAAVPVARLESFYSPSGGAQQPASVTRVQCSPLYVDLTVTLLHYSEHSSILELLPLLLILQIGFPLQYNQYPIRRFFWNIGFIAQAIIHKVLPFLISPPLFLMIQDPKMSYSKILAATERSRQLVNVLGVLLAVAVAWLVRRFVL